MGSDDKTPDGTPRNERTRTPRGREPMNRVSDDAPLPWKKGGDVPPIGSWNAPSRRAPPTSDDAAWNASLQPPAPPARAAAPPPPPPETLPVEERASGPFSPGARIVMGTLALAAAFLYATLAGDFLRRSLPFTAILAFVQGVAVALFFAGIAVTPGLVQRALGKRTVADLRRKSHLVAIVLVAITALAVFGSLDPVGEIERRLTGAPSGTSPVGVGITPVSIALSLVFNIVILLVPPLLWYRLVWNRRDGAMWHDLRLVDARGVRNFLRGSALAIAVILIYVVIATIVASVLGGFPTNERADELARAVNLPLAFAIAIVAALTEEVFFRGFLQPRIGVVAQAALFALAHLSYLSVVQIIVTFALGLVFGLAYRRTNSLWTPIGAHFTFNLVMLLIGIAARDFAPASILPW